jgi:hypothetical protein
VRVSSLIIASKRLWIGTGNGVVLSIPFTSDEHLSKPSSSSGGKKPGMVVRVNSETKESTSLMTAVNPQQQTPLDLAFKIPYCNLSDAQFSFHGHRDAVKFFLNVPNQNIKKALSNAKLYEKAESVLILSGGHGYIDFRIGDSKQANTASKAAVDKMEDFKAAAAANTLDSNYQDLENKKIDRSYLIVCQINNE